jgi:hypothetical protein
MLILDPILDEKAAAHAANNISYDPNVLQTIKNYVNGRRNYLIGVYSAENAVFRVDSASTSARTAAWPQSPERRHSQSRPSKSMGPLID